MKALEFRNHTAFWWFGMCNSFAFIVMLSAANDIVSQQTDPSGFRDDDSANSTVTCEMNSKIDQCKNQPLGLVVLANVIPAFIIKMLVPFVMHRIPFSLLHILVCVAQATSYLLVAFSSSIPMSLLGVGFAALSSGLGDLTYLALSSHYGSNIISSWSSGTGGSGIFGSILYAALTEKNLIGLSPQQALLTMLVVPVVFFLIYFFVLTPASTVYSPTLNPKTWIIPTAEISKLSQRSSANQIVNCESESDDVEQQKYEDEKMSISQRLRAIIPLLKFILPLTCVYLMDYTVQQGMTAFIVFDCSNGLRLTKDSQYRWFQVCYCCGAFLARTFTNFLELPFFFLYLFPIYEILNAVFFFFEALHDFIPHISIIFVLVLIEGAIGGASYANTYFRIHKEIEPSKREFSLAITTMSDVVGIASAGLLTLPIHSFICDYFSANS
ncbi:Battenin [Aphelenchoides besseyi]|nr:Battenin [Aphelenchoides besseyi]KAI6231097.1 Battenin [Aphelenchoides besseyi]